MKVRLRLRLSPFDQTRHVLWVRFGVSGWVEGAISQNEQDPRVLGFSFWTIESRSPPTHTIPISSWEKNKREPENRDILTTDNNEIEKPGVLS
jgi:hypothetical protein